MRVTASEATVASAEGSALQHDPIHDSCTSLCAPLQSKATHEWKFIGILVPVSHSQCPVPCWEGSRRFGGCCRSRCFRKLEGVRLPEEMVTGISWNNWWPLSGWAPVLQDSCLPAPCLSSTGRNALCQQGQRPPCLPVGCVGRRRRFSSSGRLEVAQGQVGDTGGTVSRLHARHFSS